MQTALIGFAQNFTGTMESGARWQIVLRVIATQVLLFCLVFAAYMAWKMVFYAAWQVGADVREAFPLVYQPDMFLKMAQAHPKLFLFAHGIAGSIAMITGAIQFLAILRGVKSRWHAMLGKTYAIAALIASATAIPLAWSLYHDMLLTSIAYTAGAVAWFVATILAVYTIIKGDLDRHIAWIIRSFIYLAMVVTARLLLIAVAIAGSGEWTHEAITVQYAAIIVGTFVINVGLGEWVVARVRAR